MSIVNIETTKTQAHIDKKDLKLQSKVLDSLSQQIYNIKDILKQYTVEQLSYPKKIAYGYLHTLNKLYQDYIKFINAYNHCQQLIEKINSGQEGLAQQYRESRKILDDKQLKNLIFQAYQQTDLFSIAIQSLMSKSAEIYFVHQSRTGKVVQVYKINKLEDILKYQKSNSRIQARISPAKKSLDDLKGRIPKEEYAVGAEGAKKLDIIYQTIISRYNKYRYKRRSLILWDMQTVPKWHGMWLSQKGDLAQSYAYFVLKGKQLSGNIPPTTPETGIENFMKVVQQVDAAFGGLQGDIQWIDSNGTKHSAAIKSNRATPQAIKETIILAKEFIQTDMDQTSFLKKYKDKWKRNGRNTIQEFYGETAKQIWDQVTS